jgi:hypothetical protein
MKRLTTEEIALVVNALREKASADCAAVRELEGHEKNPIAPALLHQSQLALRLVEDFECAADVEVRS